jgi:hypothetical protein
VSRRFTIPNGPRDCDNRSRCAGSLGIWQSQTLVIEPITNSTFVVGKEPEVKFDPGVDCPVERQKGLEKIGAAQACSSAVDDDEAMGELDRDEDVGRSVACRLDADTVALDVMTTLRAWAVVDGISSGTTAT